MTDHQILPAGTIIHWHGLPMTLFQDTPVVCGTSLRHWQDEVVCAPKLKNPKGGVDEHESP